MALPSPQKSSIVKRSPVAKGATPPPTALGGLGIFELNTILAFAMTAFIAFWTARAALSRGRNPWVWGGAALILGLVAVMRDDARWLNLLSVAPVLFLMLFIRPRTQSPMRRERSACPKCAAAHAPGQNFCTKCGWDLSREYTPENGDTVLASEMRQPQTPPERDFSTATMERPAETPPASAAADTPAEPAPPPATPAAPASTEAPTATGDTPAATPQPPAPAAEPEPATPRPWGIPQPSPAPTAEQMTARGATLLGEGRIQEAIDQFTKAIALDPKHREAFERRAEAYTQQGRGERAAEDYRRIQALNAGS